MIRIQYVDSTSMRVGWVDTRSLWPAFTMWSMFWLQERSCWLMWLIMIRGVCGRLEIAVSWRTSRSTENWRKWPLRPWKTSRRTLHGSLIKQRSVQQIRKTTKTRIWAKGIMVLRCHLPLNTRAAKHTLGNSFSLEGTEKGLTSKHYVIWQAW